jgi:quercetin dioxygenase-like cupin family protein
MKTPTGKLLTASLLSPFVLLFFHPLAHCQIRVDGPKPRVIQLNPAATDSTDVFKGPPDTYTMRSGYMVLAPGKSVGRHSTRNNEEALVMLSGTAEVAIAGGPPLLVKALSVAYCPPSTEHNVTNIGKDTLRYVWLVARVN